MRPLKVTRWNDELDIRESFKKIDHRASWAGSPPIRPAQPIFEGKSGFAGEPMQIHNKVNNNHYN
jgi:hypothetical protein